MRVRIKTNYFLNVEWDEIKHLLFMISEEDKDGKTHHTFMDDGSWVSVSPYMGSGEAKLVSPEEIHYRTGSGKGYYVIQKNGTITFDGYRNSFMDGTELFDCGRDKISFYTWSTIEKEVIDYKYSSSDMSRDPWHRKEFVE